MVSQNSILPDTFALQLFTKSEVSEGLNK